MKFNFSFSSPSLDTRSWTDCRKKPSPEGDQKLDWRGVFLLFEVKWGRFELEWTIKNKAQVEGDVRVFWGRRVLTKYVGRNEKQSRFLADVLLQTIQKWGFFSPSQKVREGLSFDCTGVFIEGFTACWGYMARESIFMKSHFRSVRETKWHLIDSFWKKTSRMGSEWKHDRIFVTILSAVETTDTYFHGFKNSILNMRRK